MSDPAQAQELKKQGNAFFSQGEFESAIPLYTQAIELDGTQHSFYSNRSACYAGLNRYEEALADAEKCIEVNPGWAKGYSRKGLALFKMERVEEAQEAYEQGLEKDPQNASLQEGLEAVRSAGSAARGNPFASLFGGDIWGKIAANAKLSSYLSDPTFVTAVQQLQNDPNNIQNALTDPRIQELLGVLLGINIQTAPGQGPPGSDAGAVPNEPAPTPWEEMSQPEPMQEEEPDQKAEAIAEKEEGNKCYKKRDFDAALQHYTKAMELDPTSPVYITNRSAVYFEMNNMDACVADCHTVLNMEHDSGKYLAKAFTRLGNVYYKKEEYDQAIEFFEKSLVEESSYSVKKKLRTIKATRDQKQKQAYLDTDKALEHKQAGNRLFGQQMWKEAMEEYTESLKRNPTDPKVYSNRAACFSKLMSWGSALADCNKAIELEPSYLKPYIRKGKIEHLSQQYWKALRTYKVAERLAGAGDCSDLVEAKMQAQMAVARGVSDDARQRALEDPEIQRIMQDPVVSQVLQDLKDKPAAVAGKLEDPHVKDALDTLMAAGIIRMG